MPETCQNRAYSVAIRRLEQGLKVPFQCKLCKKHKIGRIEQRTKHQVCIVGEAIIVKPRRNTDQCTNDHLQNLAKSD